jgi:hypothetical protein
LHKKVISSFRGEIREVKYYADVAMTDLILKVNIEYSRQPNGTLIVSNPLAVYGDPDWIGRRTVRIWYREDGTEHPSTKTTDKIYDNLDAMKEAVRRRSNVLDKLTLDVFQLIVATTAVNPLSPTLAELLAAESLGTAYINKYETPLSVYRQTGDLSFKVPPAIPNITDDTETWLSNSLVPIGYPAGTTIRAVLLDSLKGIME